MTEGNCKGTVYKGNIEFITKNYGKIGLTKVMDNMKNAGIVFDVNNIIDGKWYPVTTRIQFLTSAVESLNMNDEQVERMAQAGFKASTITKMFLKVASNSPKKIFELGPKVWSHNFDFGRLEGEFNGPKGSYFRIYDFPGAPVLCRCLRGYWKSVFFAAGISTIKIEETHCMSQGSDFHEFILTW